MRSPTSKLREYNVVIPDETLDRIKTIEDIVKFIKNNKQ